jgi:hypothetical protein
MTQSVQPGLPTGFTYAQATSTATLGGTALGGLVVTQATVAAAMSIPVLLSGTTTAQTLQAGDLTIGLGTVKSTGQASSTSVSLTSLPLIGATLTRALSTANPRLLLVGNVAAVAFTASINPGVSQTPFLAGITVARATLALSGTRLALQAALVVSQGSTSGFLVGTSSVFVDLGVWPAGAYVLKSRCRTDATGAPAALLVIVRAAGTQIATNSLYAAGDTASSTYPTDWSNYDGQLNFNLLVPADLTVQWSNPATYHAAGKHLWLKGAQLHRTS